MPPHHHLPHFSPVQVSEPGRGRRRVRSFVAVGAISFGRNTRPVTSVRAELSTAREMGTDTPKHAVSRSHNTLARNVYPWLRLIDQSHNLRLVVLRDYVHHAAGRDASKVLNLLLNFDHVNWPEKRPLATRL